MDFGERLDAWLVDTASSGRWLLSLYTRLRDPVQRMRAEWLERAAVDRLKRRTYAVTQKLEARSSALKAELQGLDESEAERIVWRTAFRAVCGIAMLYRFGAPQDPSLKRLEATWTRALRIAVEGYVAAFPIEIARVEVEQCLFEAVEEGVAATKDDLIKSEKASFDEATDIGEGMRREFSEDIDGVLRLVFERYEIVGGGDPV